MECRDDLTADPFFRRLTGSTWNACLGPQGAEENYVDGYIEAAQLLADSIISNELFASRDTLVLPILYNARHAIELSLKFVIRRLHADEVLPEPVRANHDIAAHLRTLERARVGDWHLRTCFRELGQYVASLAALDEDGQQLRYAMDQAGNPSLAERPIANLEVIRSALNVLGPLLQRMNARAIAFCDERKTGTWTIHCSRSDLEYIAHEWARASVAEGPDYQAVRDALKSRFQIGNRPFERAMEVIKAHREFGALFGADFELMHLSDCAAKTAIEQWSRVHPPRTQSGRVYSGRELIGHLGAHSDQALAVSELSRVLSFDELTDLETVYYLGRDRVFPEFYEKSLLATKGSWTAGGNMCSEVANLLSKSNLLTAFAEGLRRLGRLQLAEDLLAMRPDLTKQGC